MPLIAELLAMLTYCRPYGSPAETLFIARYVSCLPGAYKDVHDNWHVTIGTSPRILWSAHTDTVHRDDGRQTVHYDPSTGVAQLSRRSRRSSSCLGADCTAGVFMLRNMILRNVPGHYVFHYGEEVGGIGSQAIAEHCADWLKTFDCAIAFDRRGTDSIIVEMSYGQTASATFAQSLAAELNKGGAFTFAADYTGTYTDTAEYAGLVSECSNVSVGYRHEHTRGETLNVWHVLRLLDAICAVDQTAIVAERDASADWQTKYVSGYLWDTPSWERPHYTGEYDRYLDRVPARTLPANELSTCVSCGEIAVLDPRSWLCEDCEIFMEDDDLDEPDRATGIDAPFAQRPTRTTEQEALSEFDNCYLDPTFAEVQRALRDSQAGHATPIAHKRKAR